MPKTALFAEEPDLEALFAEAVNEISRQADEADFDVDYGFQQEWDEGEEDADEDVDLELEATKSLFDSINEFSGAEENIERFCLPLFAKAQSDYAVSYVLDSIKKRPSMMQIYAVYLGKFVANDKILQKKLLELLKDNLMFDWQRMWILATLTQVDTANDASVKVAASILADGTRHDALRAVCANYVGKFGDHGRRKALFGIYSSVSEYVQLAIYFSSRGWPTVERKNARSSWGSNGPLHQLMSAGLTSM
jgi:hypothetical protein